MRRFCLVYRLAKVATENLEIVSVCIVKGTERIAIDIEHTTHLAVGDEGNHNLGARATTTSYVPRKLFDIGYYLCGMFCPSGATHTSTLADAVTRNITLEGT